jgi:acetyl esterase
MPLHPLAQEIVDIFKGLDPLEKIGVAEGRRRSLAMMRAAPPGPAVAKVEDRIAQCSTGAIPVRIYTPEGSGPFAVLVYYHGGGWVVGSLDTSDAMCRLLTVSAQCVVVSVNYRHAPEDPFPAAAEDAHAAAVWAAENARSFNGDAGRLAVGGSSAGGNLAAVAALMARDRGGPPLVFQFLHVPITDYGFDTPSYVQNAEGCGLTRSTMRWFWNHYLKEAADGAHVYASPLRAPSLAGLPPALVITAEFDPLRDEGAAYAERLRAAGVPVDYQCYAGMVHMRQGPEADEYMGRALRTALGTSATSTRAR